MFIELTKAVNGSTLRVAIDAIESIDLPNGKDDPTTRVYPKTPEEPGEYWEVVESPDRVSQLIRDAQCGHFFAAVLKVDETDLISLRKHYGRVLKIYRARNLCTSGGTTDYVLIENESPEGRVFSYELDGFVKFFTSRADMEKAVAKSYAELPELKERILILSRRARSAGLSLMDYVESKQLWNEYGPLLKGNS